MNMAESFAPATPGERNSSKRIAELYSDRIACAREMQEIDKRISGRKRRVAQLEAEIAELKADNRMDKVYRRQHLVPTLRGILADIHAVELGRIEE